MGNQPESTRSWPGSRPNVLVVAPATVDFVTKALALRGENQEFEVIAVEAPAEGVRLVQRVNVAALLIYGQPPEPGCMEMLVEALNRENPPRIVVLSEQASNRPRGPGIRPMRCPVE